MFKKRLLSLTVMTALSFGAIYVAPSPVNADAVVWQSQLKDLKKEIKTVKNDKTGKKAAKLKKEIKLLEQKIKRENNNSSKVETPQAPEETVLEDQVEQEVQVEKAVSVMDFGVSADANFYNPSNGNYYSDKEFNVPATDDTQAINEAITYASQNGIKDVIVPSGNYLINPLGTPESYMFERATKGGIQLESNIRLKMSDDTTLVTNTINEMAYSLMVVDKKENVEIIGGNLVGDMSTHPQGEDMHDNCYGINIVNASNNVLVQDTNISKMEDDGIMIVDYLEVLSDGKRIDNVEIRNVNSSNNGRQGLTIASGNNIKVVNSEFSKQRKHLPMSGIDIELEGYDHIGVENVEITGNTFKDNKFSGVILSDMFNDMPGSMSKNMKINGNKLDNNRFGIIASGKADGLEISNNNIAIDHLKDEFSAAVGSTSDDSLNVAIKNNTIVSNNKDNFSLGVINTSPGTLISDNSLSGQRIGIVLYGEEYNLLNNMIANATALDIQRL